jgi:translocation and assembly module TamA
LHDGARHAHGGDASVASSGGRFGVERFQAKREPLRRPETRPNKELEQSRDSRKIETALARAALCGALLLCPLHVSPVAAFELFGVRLWGSPPVDPADYSYTVEIEAAGADRALRRALRDASALEQEQSDPPHSAAALLARARADYGRLVSALYAEGHYGGAVAITLDGKRIESIPPDAALPRPAAFTIRVDPGPVFVFGRISVVNAPPPDPRARGAPEYGRTQGAVAKSEKVLGAERAIVRGWRAAGYPKATIANRRIVANHDRRTLDVTLTAAHGPQAFYGPVTVSGADRVDPGFIARQAQIPEGAQFDPRDMDRARNEMRRLETFQSTRLIEGEVGPDGMMPVEIAVAERKPRVIGVGANYSTVDGVAARAYWQHRNLFGRAERLRIDGNIGRVTSSEFGDIDYGLSATFVKPGALSPRTDFSTYKAFKRETVETYQSESVTGRAGFVHRFTPHLTGSMFGSIEHSRIEDALGENDFLFASLPTELLYDSRDNEFDPTRGFNAAGSVEPFHESKFDNSGAIAQARIATYRSLRPDGSLVLAGRLAAGSIVGAPRDELPANKLFFAGGGGSVRGYAYRSIGPTLPDGQVVGGRSYFAGSVEMRAKVTDQIGLVPFLDFGSAYASEFPDFSEDMRFGAGLGLRYYTALGPLRLDLAVPLNPRKDDPEVAFYIGIGQEF